ncbi:DUF6090 family protein [Ekhidna sp. To15]|uniref:DUF6090 family protein n=1 Tax=Ekhidna sp. To15 TaxID=3395267 RepID=UPI003F524B35
MKKVNWLDHIANLLVVILGISIAFYLESYKEEESNRAQERKYLESLIKDLDTDIEYLDTLGAFNERISEALVTLSEASLGRPYGNDTALMNYTLTIQYNPPFSPQRTTYESLKASGKMDLIGSFEIRNQVVELYEQYYRGTNEYDASLNEHIRDFVKPFYMENVRFTSSQSIGPDFLSKNEFRNVIFAYRHLFLAKDSFYQTVRDRAEEVKNMLEEYLEEG